MSLEQNNSKVAQDLPAFLGNPEKKPCLVLTILFKNNFIDISTSYIGQV